MIEAHGITKSFAGRPVLHGVDLQVATGEVVAIIGPSGSGKSTLLRCLNLLETPDAGTIRIQDATATAPRIPARTVHELRRRTAMVFQGYNLFRNRTALQNVMDPLVIGQRMPRQQAEARARELLGRVGIAGPTVGQYPITLSGGQQQRVSIARALAVQPHAILLDEPTSALDPELVGEVLAVIRDLAEQDITLVIVTHEMAFAADVADRAVVLQDGRIIAEGPAREVIDARPKGRTRTEPAPDQDRPPEAPR